MGFSGTGPLQQVRDHHQETALIVSLHASHTLVVFASPKKYYFLMNDDYAFVFAFCEFNNYLVC